MQLLGDVPWQVTLSAAVLWNKQRQAAYLTFETQNARPDQEFLDPEELPAWLEPARKPPPAEGGGDSLGSPAARGW